MRLILLGPPGSGKGTQAKMLSLRLELTHVGTGDMLREAIRLETPAGRAAKPFVGTGQLAPDDLVNQIVADYFRQEDRPESFVLDGYPRTLPQAMSFEQVLRQQFLGIDAAVELQVADDDIVRRMVGRWVCSSCGTPYHTEYKPSRMPGVCDLCGSKLIQREDDKEQTVRRRLQIFHSGHDDLVEYYGKMGLLRQVPGIGDIETIYTNIIKAIG
jgi:adenylate kinase